mgnify:CR=1 FL=1
MPYIKEHERSNIDAAFFREMNSGRHDWSFVAATMTPGQLNYLFTRFIVRYFNYSPNYQRIDEILGTLDAVAKEFYRRVAVPYEEKKLEENGDVY